MTLTSSGQISINDINGEFGRSGTTADSSLKELSDGTVATINTVNDADDRPDGSAPHNMTEFYSYDHDAAAATSWSTSGNTGLNVGGEAGTTDMANSFATLVLSNGSGGIDIENFTTSGGPFGSLRFQYTTDGSTPSTSNSGTSSITQLQNSLSSFNSGTLKLRPGWLHEPSNKDGTGSYSFTVRNNSVDSSALTGSITFLSGGFCIHHSILVNTPNGMKNINDLSIDDIVYSYNFSSGEIQETPILQIETPTHSRLIRIMYEDNDNELNNIIVTRDHPIFLEDGSMASYDPQKTKDLYNLNANKLEEGNVMKTISGTKTIHRFEYIGSSESTYTIKTSNDNFYAGNILVHSELE
tara:strand:+ start:2407 stop:3471 length:1065 start_codon:yes stop_codon:yes gene_type:complete